MFHVLSQPTVYSTILYSPAPRQTPNARAASGGEVRHSAAARESAASELLCATNDSDPHRRNRIVTPRLSIITGGDDGDTFINHPAELISLMK